MGLLDDAIREHLELKRLRGADPSDVIRQEREVLGADIRDESPAGAPAADLGERFEDGEAHGGRGAPGAGQEEGPAALADELWVDGPASPPGPSRPTGEPELGTVTDQETAEVDMSEMLELEEVQGLGEHPEPGEPATQEHRARLAAEAGEPQWGEDERPVEADASDEPAEIDAADSEDWLSTVRSWERDPGADDDDRDSGDDLDVVSGDEAQDEDVEDQPSSAGG